MSLFELLSLGRKETPKEDIVVPEPRVEKQQTAQPAAKELELELLRSLRHNEELELLREHVGKQSEEQAKKNEVEEVAMKRALEDAVDQVSALAKKRREENIQKTTEYPFRTALCRFFNVNACDKGMNCPFAHGADNLMTPTNRPQIVMLGTSLGTAASLGASLAMSSAGASASAGKFKKEMCRFFLANACTKGESCTYAHSPAELYGPDSASKSAAGNMEWQDGGGYSFFGKGCWPDASWGAAENYGCMGKGSWGPAWDGAEYGSKGEGCMGKGSWGPPWEGADYGSKGSGCMGKGSYGAPWDGADYGSKGSCAQKGCGSKDSRGASWDAAEYGTGSAESAWRSSKGSVGAAGSSWDGKEAGNADSSWQSSKGYGAGPSQTGGSAVKEGRGASWDGAEYETENAESRWQSSKDSSAQKGCGSSKGGGGASWDGAESHWQSSKSSGGSGPPQRDYGSKAGVDDSWNRGENYASGNGEWRSQTSRGDHGGIHQESMRSTAKSDSNGCLSADSGFDQW